MSADTNRRPPAEQSAPGDMFLAWWTSIETDTRKSLLVGAHRDPERLHALLRTAYEADRDQLPPSVVPIATSTDMARMMLALGHRYLQENAPEQLAQPAPASTGRGIAEEMCSTMMGVAELKLKMAKSKEQVEAALEISGARELDVEAERRAMFQAFSECLVHGNSMTPTEIADKLLAARSAAQGTAPASNAMMDAWSRYIFELEQKIVALEAQVAAQPESAPVSTEQAGDAWQLIETAPHDKILLLAYEFDGPGDWRIKVGGYWNGQWNVFGASWTPTRWMSLPAAPSPNNSPVGADRRE